jgi:peroxiredoxin (alkyl hydroperoxide reductase subunit C)
METLIQKSAPDFNAEAVMPNGEFANIKLSDFKGKKYVVLFFYPLDFTFVCPSEILAFSNRIKDFEARDTQVIGVSIDSKFSHFAWRNTAVDQGGIGQVTFPLVADLNKQISRDYGVLLDEAVALRGTFLIDKAGVVRHATLNDLPLGRNIDETIRLVDALQHTEKHGEVCPAGWAKGETAMVPTAEGVASFLKEKAAAL